MSENVGIIKNGGSPPEGTSIKTYLDKNGSHIQVVGVADDPYLGISLGLFNGRVAITKFGTNEAAPTGNRDIWAYGSTALGDSDLDWATGAETLNVASTSALDSSAGTGARTLQIDGLDSNFLAISEVVTLDGLNNVETNNAFVRVNRAFIVSTGIYTGSNVGGLTMTQSVSGRVIGYVRPVAGQTEQTHYTVPAGKIALMRHAYSFVNAGANKSSIIMFNMRLNADVVSAPFSGARTILIAPGVSGQIDMEMFAVNVFPAKTDLWMRSDGEAATAVTGIYQLIIDEV